MRLVPRLAERGVTVRAVSRKTNFDWARPETFPPAVAGVDAVYLIPPAFIADATPMVRPFLVAAKAAGAARVVVVSSLGVEFPHEPKTSGRIALERCVQDSGLEWTVLRPGGFAQNFSESFMLPGVRQGTVVSATGTGAVAFIDADNIAAVAAAALTEPGHASATYALTGPSALTFSEAVAIISKVSGRPVTHRAISGDEFAAMLAGFGLPPDYAAILVRDQRGIAEGAGARVSDVVARITTPITFAQFAERAAQSWR